MRDYGAGKLVSCLARLAAAGKHQGLHVCGVGNDFNGGPTRLLVAVRSICASTQALNLLQRPIVIWAGLDDELAEASLAQAIEKPGLEDIAQQLYKARGRANSDKASAALWLHWPAFDHDRQG